MEGGVHITKRPATLELMAHLRFNNELCLFIASSSTPPPDRRGTTRPQDSSSDFRRSNTRGSSMQQSNRKRDYTNRICFQRWIQEVGIRLYRA